MTCPRLARCPMFPKFSLKETLGVWKAIYCEGKYSACRRFQLFQAGLPVKEGLLPDGSVAESPFDNIGQPSDGSLHRG